MKKRLNKKGALEEVQALIAPLIGITIVLIVGFLIFAEGKEIVTARIGTNTTNNEEFVHVNNTFVALTYSPASIALSCLAVSNGTGGAVILSGNYTCNTSGIRVVDNDGLELNTTLLVNYTWKLADKAYNATSDVQNATSDIPGWLPIIIITIIGAILLGLVQWFRGKK